MVGEAERFGGVEIRTERADEAEYQHWPSAGINQRQAERRSRHESRKSGVMDLLGREQALLNHQGGAESVRRFPVVDIGALDEVVVVIDKVGGGLQKHRSRRSRQVLRQREARAGIERQERAHRHTHEGHPERERAARL